VFESDDDRWRYLELLSAAASDGDIEVLAWCLMVNHVHFVVIPRNPESIARTLGVVQGRYSREFHQRSSRGGHLWQGRYFSCPLDDSHLLAAVRYVELNPVRAGLVVHAWDYGWSSARAHVLGEYAEPLHRAPLLDAEIRDWRSFLDIATGDDMESAIRRATTAGVPAGNKEFRDRLEKEFGRSMRDRRVGRPQKVP
jgi:putative transposase